jgi:dipeptidyl-peptidase-4
MRSLLKTLTLPALTFLLTISGYAAETNKPAEPKLYRAKIDPHWFDHDNKFWYRLDLAKGKREFILVDAEKGSRAPAFDHVRLAKVLSEKTGKEVDPEHLPFDSIKISDDAKTFQISGEKNWQFNFETYEATEDKTERAEKTETPREERRRNRTREAADKKSPDDKWEAIIHGDNIFLRDGSGKERQVSFEGNPSDSYKHDAQRERFVEMEWNAKDPENPAPEVYWSPDSEKFVAIRTQAGTQRLVYLVESSPKDQLQPKLQSYPYLKPGDQVPIGKPHLFEAASGREIPIDDALFANPWSISDVRWATNSSRFTFVFNQRGHQILRVLAVDAGNGKVTPIIEEKSDTFIDYSGKFYCEYLDETGEIIWASERDGWNHLYLYDAITGNIKNQITKGDWLVRAVEHIDKEKRQIWFRAGGIHPAQDPYYVHFCRIDFDGSGLVALTEGDGTHTAQFSPDRRFLIDTWSRVDFPPVLELRRCDDGKFLCKLEEADTSELLAIGRKPPERFVANGRDGATDIYGVIFWPPNLDPARKYPVIENIYAGPHGSFVPKNFRPTHSSEKLSERGFIVVQIDGMGTSNRSRKFHDVCWKNLADSGFADRIAWIKAAAEKYPEFDLSRVGLFGGSAGGQSALAGLLWHGDFYKAAVADCGCHDNRMDKIWWNEQWMGWPIGPQYQEQSNVTQAHRLEGKLLLLVGELDKNVDPSSTMQVVNALVKADKDFEMLVLPGAGHGVGGTPYGWRRTRDFFIRTFLNGQPSAAGSVAAGAN